MRKANFFYVIFFSLFLVACSNITNSAGNLPASTGNLNEVAVFVDNNLWNGEIGDSIREKLAYPIDGLINEETSLVIKQYAPHVIDNSAKKARNIVVIEKGNENEFIHIENEFAFPQNVFHFKGETISDILELIHLHGDVVENAIRFYELLQIQSQIAEAPFDDARIREKFNISLLIPESYNYALTAPNFAWLKRNTPTGSNSIMVYQVPVSRFAKGDLVRNFVAVRDSITKKYVKGVPENSYMHVNTSYAPFVKKIFLYEDVDAFEFRGTWDLTNDYMEGPYLCYLFITPNAANYVFVDGFVYNPTLPNRDDIFELEAIIKSIYFNFDEVTD
ncbi:DUF4837 family protein [Flavobacterium agricola]|uniref:DUF4837 family protein n=1 Tax=Flavobacterium agricola TaxID=2870839 RepID=A0ABY6LXG7_9FLAO|nr:DUF4837 family protein [Flavobacterium agricola]UYW01027.1 DUF4837 family protein [Flavobacterium agricola]